MWGSTCVGGRAHIQQFFISTAWLGIDAFAAQRCPVSFRVGIDLAPLHPNASCQEPAEFGVQALQRPREGETQFASHESPFRCGLRKVGETGKMNRFLLFPATGLNRGSLQELISVLRGEPQGCGCKELPWQALPLQWV